MSRTLILIYGAVVYTLFLGVFLYAIGFVGNLVVPRGIDSPPVDSSWTGFAINLALLSLFAVQHSVMARKGFKERWTKIVPKPAERATFVLATVIVLSLLMWQWRAMPGVIWSVEAELGRWLLYGLSFFGWGIVLLATFLIDHFELFGLKQVINHYRGVPQRGPSFVTPSLYRYVRHPLYLGFMIAFWATPDMTVGHLLFAAVTTLYMIAAVVLFEEKDLIRQFGEQYIQYRRRVPMVIPLPKRSARSDRTTNHS